MVSQLNHILEAIAALQDVDTSAVGPTAQVIPLENVMRADEPRAGISRDSALANAPLREDVHLRVQVVLEEGRKRAMTTSAHVPETQTLPLTDHTVCEVNDLSQ